MKFNTQSEEKRRTQCRCVSLYTVSPDSVVGIATRYGLNGPGIESRGGGKIFHTQPHQHWGPASLLHDGYRIIPGSKADGATKIYLKSENVI